MTPVIEVIRDDDGIPVKQAGAAVAEDPVVSDEDGGREPSWVGPWAGSSCCSWRC